MGTILRRKNLPNIAHFLKEKKDSVSLLEVVAFVFTPAYILVIVIACLILLLT